MIQVIARFISRKDRERRRMRRMDEATSQARTEHADQLRSRLAAQLADELGAPYGQRS